MHHHEPSHTKASSPTNTAVSAINSPTDEHPMGARTLAADTASLLVLELELEYTLSELISNWEGWSAGSPGSAIRAPLNPSPAWPQVGKDDLWIDDLTPHPLATYHRATSPPRNLAHEDRLR
jgi:hypothetical protein